MVPGRGLNQEPSVYKATMLYTHLQRWLSLQGLRATFVAYNESQENMIPLARSVLSQH
jgi:hypothetical protein